MEVKLSTLLNTVLASVFLTSIFLGTTTTQSSTTVGEYDPWIDYDGDGRISYKDLFALAAVYGSSGDPTKNVNVTNWPKSSYVLVWWQANVPPSLYSPVYTASGFGHLHVLASVAALLTGDTITLCVEAIIWDPSHEFGWSVTVYSVDLTKVDYQDSFTIPVPSDEFQFIARPVGTSEGVISLSFYLTWA